MKSKRPKLSPSVRRKITDRWSTAFPDFAVYEPMWLMKRNGPVLVGICLERFLSNDEYRPIVHLHNLSCPTGFVTLSAAVRVYDHSGRRELRLSADCGELELEGAITLVKRQSTIPLVRRLSLSEVLEAYQPYISGTHPGAAFPIFELDSVIRALTWCRKLYRAKELLEDIEVRTEPWDPFVFRHFHSREVCLQTLYQTVANPSDLAWILDGEVEKLRVKHLPDYGLLCS